MPVESRSGTKQVTSVVFALIAVGIAVALAWGMLTLASGGDGPVRLRLGDDKFDAGNAVRLSKQTGADGPVLFPDVSGRGQRRPIYVNHFGDDAEIRWVAFPARLDDAPDGCFLFWNAASEVFEERLEPESGSIKPGEKCSDTTFPANGEGLHQYTWTVGEDGRLVIDIRGDEETTTTTGG